MYAESSIEERPLTDRAITFTYRGQRREGTYSSFVEFLRDPSCDPREIDLGGEGWVVRMRRAPSAHDLNVISGVRGAVYVTHPRRAFCWNPQTEEHDEPCSPSFCPGTYPCHEGRVEYGEALVFVFADRRMTREERATLADLAKIMALGESTSAPGLYTKNEHTKLARTESSEVIELTGDELTVDPCLETIARHAIARAEKSAAMNTAILPPAPQATTQRWTTPAQRARKVGGHGVRLRTAFPSIDSATRGGLLLKKTVVIGGAPGAGKTATAVQLAYRWLTEGVHVGFLAADEDADAILIRFGQLAGLSRELLENGDPDEREKLARWCESVPLMLVDGDEETATIEAVSIALVHERKGAPSVLVADSIQTLRSRAAPSKDADARARVNVVVRALKHAAKVDGHLVVATSEISKAAYRNRDQAENVNPLSAFKESGDIEYGVGLALVLVSRAGSSELVDAVVAKNRLGPGKPSLLLRLDHARAGVTEANAAEASIADPLFGTKAEIMAAIDELAGATISKNKLHDRVGGNRKNNLRAIAELVAGRRLFETEKGVRAMLPGDPGFEETGA